MAAYIVQGPFSFGPDEKAQTLSREPSQTWPQSTSKDLYKARATQGGSEPFYLMDASNNLHTECSSCRCVSGPIPRRECQLAIFGSNKSGEIIFFSLLLPQGVLTKTLALLDQI